MRVSKFNNYEIINEESAVRMPVSEDYWIKKGKSGKNVAMYLHDDMDGMFTAIEMKKYLLNKGFKIVKYGILNYTDGWKYTTLDPKLINVVLDFANMPGDERDQLIDFYLDHHGLFSEEELEKYKKSPVKKLKTGSAYEALIISLGIPQDSLKLEVIDMIDSAKYEYYGVPWKRLLDFNLSEIKESPKRRLEFGAAFNQFLKRSDINTMLEVVKNCDEASIFGIFQAMKRLYPGNNPNLKGPKKGEGKDFIEDSLWRQGEMMKRTRGSAETKKHYQAYKEFTSDWMVGNKIGKLDGYQLIGDLIFVPSGTWANALRARSIAETDFKEGRLSKVPKFILLQYGSTLQVCSYEQIEKYEDLPVLKSGEKVDDLGKYMTGLLNNFQKHLGYHDPDTSIGQDEITVSGGHGGIGSISNIFAKISVLDLGDDELKCRLQKYDGVKYVDMFKNKIISDLSGVEFPIGLVWSDTESGKSKEPEMDSKVRGAQQLREVDPKTGRVKRFGEI